jgi:two-component system chemotaxis response regulator CheY
VEVNACRRKIDFISEICNIHWIILRKEEANMAKILIVDDAAFIRMMIKDILSKNGYNDLYEACDGIQAVEIFESIKPDLVLMDFTLQKKDGLEVLKEIRKSDPYAKVIMTSAVGQESLVIKAIKAGANDFILKPYKANWLLKIVSENID